MSGKIRILIADDQRLFAESLSYVIAASAPDMEVLGIAGDGVEAVAMAERLKPDLVLMDVRMPQMDGVDAARLILARLPALRVLMLSTFLDKDHIRSAVDHGARGYLLKDIKPAELVAAIRAVHGGATLFSNEVSRELGHGRAKGDGQADDPSLDAILSPREDRVAALMLKSYGNRQIAEHLGLSEQTVRNYISAIYFKLGVKDRFEFMRKASGSA